MNGFELLKKLRSDDYTSHTLIIILTAKTDADSKLQNLQGGEFYNWQPCLAFTHLLP